MDIVIKKFYGNYKHILHCSKLHFCTHIKTTFCDFFRLAFVKNCPKWALRSCRNWRNTWVLKSIMKQCLGHVKQKKQILKERIKIGKNKYQLWLLIAYEGEFLCDKLTYKLNAKRNETFMSFSVCNCIHGMYFLCQMCPSCGHNLSEVRPPTELVGSCVVGVAVGVGVVVEDKTKVFFSITPLQCIFKLTYISMVFCGFPTIRYSPFFSFMSLVESP